MILGLCFLALLLTFLTYMEALIGVPATQRITEEIGSWKISSEFFQYKDFYIESITYMKNQSACEHLNVSIEVGFAENYTYSICSVVLNEYVVQNFVGVIAGRVTTDEIFPAKRINITVQDVDGRKDHSLRFCCDTYCNLMDLGAVCNDG
jgi:hypothetical protein